MEEKSICAIVRERENDYVYGVPTKLGKYVEFKQYENIERIDAYLNSKHISGSTDSKNREKPFFNIVVAAVNIWYRATSGNTTARVRATKNSDVLSSFLASIKLEEWMTKSRFRVFLKEWGRALAKYGSVIVKFVEQDGELYPMVMPWNRMITDTIDFANNIKIEKIYLTPSQLRKRKGYNQKIVEQLIEKTNSTRKNLDKTRTDNIPGYIELYEVHGELSLATLKRSKGEEPTEKDGETYVQQMHVVSFVAGDKKDEYDDFTLISGREEKDPYMITHLIKEDGREQSIGAVEYLFDAQWMVNHTAKAIKDQLDLASKLIFQTSDGAFVGRNVLTEIETGDILNHAINQPLTQIANNSHDITSLQGYQNQWLALSKEITATPDALRGNPQPSGTAYRLQQLITTEASSLFEEMVESKELAIEDMMREFVLPHIKKSFDTSDEISAILAEHDIKKIDSMYVPNEVVRRVNRKVVKRVLEGNMVSPMDQAQMMQNETQSLQQDLNAMGNQRFIKPSDVEDTTWKEVFKDLEWELEVKIDRRNDENLLTTLSTMLQTLATNPGVLQDPNMKLIFTKILEISGGISPLELSNQPQPVPSPMQLGNGAVSNAVGGNNLPVNSQTQ